MISLLLIECVVYDAATMSDESALLAAIIAHADEDTPRLIYADWLEEHEAPIQAEFIRLQCRLASCSAADPNYPDLLERYAEVVARFQPLAKYTVPELPPGFKFYNDLTHDHENFRRGFLHTVHGSWVDGNWVPSDEQVEQIHTGLSQLITTTTARQLSLINTNREHLTRILTAPGIDAITGLDLHLAYQNEEAAELLAVLAASPCVRGLARLSLVGYTTGLAPLAATKFPRLQHLGLPVIFGQARDIRWMTEAKWFRELRSIRAGGSDEPVVALLLSAFAKLPRLESLDVGGFYLETVKKAFGSTSGFPVLARLTVSLLRGQTGVAYLAKGRFPQLAELEVKNIRSEHIPTLLKAKWLPRLRVLTLRDGTLSDKSVVALSKSPVAANLRILRLIDIPLGKTALAALGDGTRFPNLTTLELSTTSSGKITTADMAAFARALNLPRLQHLNLSSWSLGDTGAKALAENPSLANLTRLLLSACVIREKGLAAIVRSPHLQQLIELDMRHNKLKTATALRNKNYLPHLAAAHTDGNRIPHAAHRKLTLARGLTVR